MGRKVKFHLSILSPPWLLCNKAKWFPALYSSLSLWVVLVICSTHLLGSHISTLRKFTYWYCSKTCYTHEQILHIIVHSSHKNDGHTTLIKSKYKYSCSPKKLNSSCAELEARSCEIGDDNRNCCCCNAPFIMNPSPECTTPSNKKKV